MKKTYKIEGYLNVNGEVRDIEISYENLIENESKNNKLLSLLNHPWRLIKEGGKLGVSGIKTFFGIFFLFSISNTFLFFYSMVRLFSTEFAFSKIFYVLLVLIGGLGITAFAVYRAYQFVVIDTMRVIYENLSALFHKISSMIIDKAESLFDGKIDFKGSQLSKAIDYGKMVNEKYQKFPKFLRKGIVLILKRIPVAGMLFELKDEIMAGNKVAASVKLYAKMDAFISDSIFGNNNTKWVWWLLPLNILAFLLLIKLKIG